MEDFTIVILILAIIISISMIVVFFGMASQIKNIRKSVDTKSHDYWQGEYRLALLKGNKESVKNILYNHMFYYIMSHDNDTRKGMYGHYKKNNIERFDNLGIKFPEWDEDIFN